MTPREEFEKENKHDVYAYYQEYGGGPKLKNGFSDDYVLWLEQQIPIREQQAWDAREEEIPAISGPAGRKYQTINEWRENK